MAIGAEVVRSPGARVDIGALESTSGSAAPIPMNGAQPLIPPSAVNPMAPAPEHPRAGPRPQLPETGTDDVAPAGSRGRRRPATGKPGLHTEAVWIPHPLTLHWL